MVNGACKKCGCSEAPEGECGNCRCKEVLVEHRFEQHKENCDSEELCFKLKFFRKDDPTFDSSQLLFKSGALNIILIRDSLAKEFIHILYKDSRGELILRFPSKLELPEGKFLSMGRDRVISLSNGIAYKTTTEIQETPFLDKGPNRQRTGVAKMAGRMLGGFLGALDESLNGIFIFSSMLGIDPHGMIIAFS